MNNVFDTVPPFDTGRIPTPFFYSRFGNVRLRDYILRVKKISNARTSSIRRSPHTLVPRPSKNQHRSAFPHLPLSAPSA